VLWAKVVLGSALVRSACHLGWPGGQVLWPHRLSHLGSSSYRRNMTHVESVISLAPNLGRPAKEWADWLLAVLKPNRIICKRTDANCSSIHLRIFLGLSNPQGQR
jgi:hypothetical protein